MTNTNETPSKCLGCEDACTPWSHWKEKGCSETCDYGITSRTRARICALTSCDDREEGIGQCKRHTCPGKFSLLFGLIHC